MAGGYDIEGSFLKDQDDMKRLIPRAENAVSMS